MYVYIELIHFVVQQKLTQHCKAIILQLKKKRISVNLGACLKNPMDRGAWWATVHTIARSPTYWSNLTCMHEPDIMDGIFLPDFEFRIFIEV